MLRRVKKSAGDGAFLPSASQALGVSSGGLSHSVQGSQSIYIVPISEEKKKISFPASAHSPVALRFPLSRCTSLYFLSNQVAHSGCPHASIVDNFSTSSVFYLEFLESPSFLTLYLLRRDWIRLALYSYLVDWTMIPYNWDS